MFVANIRGRLEDIKSEGGTYRLWNIITHDFIEKLPKDVPVVLTFSDEIYHNDCDGPYHTRELRCEMQNTTVELGFDYRVRGTVQEEFKTEVKVSRVVRLWQLITGN